MLALGASLGSAAARASTGPTPSPTAQAAEVGPAPRSQQLQLVLPLAAGLAGLRRFALSVSTPGSTDYRQYEPIFRLARRFGATAATRRRVVAFLLRAGARDVTLDATGLFADATVSAGVAERLFATPLSVFRTRRERFLAPAAPVSVPAGLRGLVTGVIGLDTRSLFTAPAQPAGPGERPSAHAAATQPPSAYLPRTGTAAGCAAGQQSGGFTPNQYLTAYGYGSLQGAGLAGEGERVALIEVEGFKSSDIDGFARCFGLRVPAIDSFGVGVKKALPPGAETTLDLEVLDAAAPGLKAIDVYESPSSAAQTLRALTAPLQNPGFKPQVISASLGQCEPFVFEAIGRGGIVNTEGALEEAAASGITIVAAAGDSGSAGCNASGVPIDQLAVNYPASSWWVTAVGGTNLTLTAANTLAGQLVWNDTTVAPGEAGGGGSSDLFTRPPYQNGTVAANSRTVPDVSMLADVAPGYAIFCSLSVVGCSPKQPWTTVGGTSAATPLLAGGLALVDQDLRRHSRQDLGQLNPLLYRIGRNRSLIAQVFDDVAQFGNDVGPYIPGNGRALGCCTAGPGYDQASGWGGVNLASLASVAITQQPAIVDVGLRLPAGQHPIASHQIQATVSCTGACVIGAIATVTIGRTKRLTVYSNLFHLTRAGKKTIPIRFSSGQLGTLRAGVRQHRRIVAGVTGAIVDAGGNIERRTASLSLVVNP
jgi:subtilase family serine protease